MQLRYCVLAFWLLSTNGCSVTSHPVAAAALGVASRGEAVVSQLDVPGPIELTTVRSSDWVIDRSGLLNLEHEKAIAAHLEDGDEPIQVYFHVLKHPTQGTFIVDTGVENALRDKPEQAAVRGLAATVFGTKKMRIGAPLGSWLDEHQVKLSGVFLTHLHADHMTGLPDVPRGTPIYIGAGEARATALLNAALRGTMDRLLEGHAPLRELAFAGDRDGRFEGVRDVFGDGSLFAILVPGHTVGSLAFVARTTQGPVLLTGDTCHTAWGWEHDVEPGSFTSDHEANARSLAQLRRLVREHPDVAVRLGHQEMIQPRAAL
jgi:glyoxylase-like metal-dependent hydrolase (beta-lactamase superfamily II)